MDIKDIKQQLSITQVLSYYGLQADKNQRICCPFHDDKSPSMQVYEKTNTYCCFSSNCTAGTGDQIQFIQLKENCNKHEALKKATNLLQATGSVLYIQSDSEKNKVKPTVTNPPQADRQPILEIFFNYYKTGLPRTKKAVAYLQHRSIDYKKIEMAFNSGGMHVESRHHHLISDLVQAGLIKALPVQGHSVWAKDCIIFPLKNAANKIVSLYGRSITDNENNRHFYLQNRNGLYPNYPKQETTKLILTESIIDAASLLQIEAIKKDYAILALYGTNGLTDEHQEAILKLNDLQEIILMMDNDEAGAAATLKHNNTLSSLLPSIKITAVVLPCKDVNETLQAHPPTALGTGSENIFTHLLSERKTIDFSFSIEKDNAVEQSEMPQGGKTTTNTTTQQSKLNTTNSELLIYSTESLTIEILGGIKIVGLDRLKVTLKITHNQKRELPIRDTLDLYNRNQTEQLLQTITESFDSNIQQTATTISDLTNELENYRVQKIEALQPKEKQKRELTAAERTQAIAELQNPNLLERTNQLIGLTGITGEEQNRLIAYLIYSVRKQQVPLHVMFLGSSGSGKTYLQERISELIPEEDSIEITQITENALYYFKQEELKNKLLLIEDLDGAMAVFYPLRELQTKRRISKTVTLKDSKGNLKTITLTVEGPVCVSGCTTKEKLYEDNANRCFLLYTDQSPEQDKRINEYQTELAAGTINKVREQQYKQLFKNMQSLLQPILIKNPYAKYIVLPEQVFKPRRTMTLLLGFIEAITFYHQHQRTVKKDSDNQNYIETTIEDIQAAFTLLQDVLFSKADELTKATRSFLENLKQHLIQGKANSFTPQQIRKAFRIEPRTIQRYIRELKQYGFIKQISGFTHRKGFEYSIVDGEEYKQLKSTINEHLESILSKLQEPQQ
jgi:DNA primase